VSGVVVIVDAGCLVERVAGIGFQRTLIVGRA
jgi:hypothetical protein